VNPEQRFQRVADLCAALERTSTAAAAPSRHRSRQPVAPPAGVTRHGYMPVLTVAIAACLLLVASVIWGGAGWRRPPTPPAVESGPIRLAILPFRVDGLDDGRVLELGLADSLITRLAGVRELQLRPTAAIARFDSSHPNATDVGRDLDVDYVLRGSVTGRGDRYDVTLQLVRSTDGVLVWGDPFTLPRTPLLQLEELIATRVALALKVPVTEKARARAARGATANAEAHVHYVAGRSRFFQKGQIDLALESFENAVRLDPGYARAYAGLAHALARKYWDPQPTEVAAQYRARAMRAAEQALQLEPDLAEGHEALSTIHRYTEAEWHKAIEEAQKALELDPALELPHHNMASAFYHLGLFELSDQESRAGVKANPDSRLHAQLNRARAALYDGRFSVAQQLTGEVSAADDAGVAWLLAEIRFALGDVEWSERTLERVARGSPGVHGERAQASLASVLAFSRRRAAAETWLGRLKGRPVTDHHVSYRMATAYAQLARPREAVHWLGRTVDTGFPCYPWFTKDTLLDPVRQDPAFQALMTDQRAQWEVRRVRYAPVRRAF
jgi:TolB-like protein